MISLTLGEDKHHLVCFDYYSEYFEVTRIFGKKKKEVISRLKSQFTLLDMEYQINLQVTMDHLSVQESSKEFALTYEFEHKLPMNCRNRSKVIFIGL